MRTFSTMLDLVGPSAQGGIRHSPSGAGWRPNLCVCASLWGRWMDGFAKLSRYIYMILNLIYPLSGCHILLRELDSEI